MHFHCWELAVSGGKSDAFVLKGEAIDLLEIHGSCDNCCECFAGRYTFSVRREVASTSPDMKQLPLCARCNKSIEVGDFCGTNICIGKTYRIEFNLCGPCRELMTKAIKDLMTPEKKFSRKDSPRRNIII